jgi:hypothetical protein
MKKILTMKFLAKVGFLVFLIIFCIGVVILYPQFYCCKNQFQLGQYKIYFCGNDESNNNRAAITTVINRVDKLLRKSELFDHNLHFKIFIRSNNYSCINLPWQFNEKAYGQTIPLFYNIFISKVNIGTSEAFNGAGHSRPLPSVVAHELTHVLYENKFGWIKTRLYDWLDGESKSKLGLLWKEEGYAEYIAGGQAINVAEGLQILKGKSDPHYNKYEVEYFKCWFAIKYLIEVKHLSISQIINMKISLDTVLQQAMIANNQVKN